MFEVKKRGCRKNAKFIKTKNGKRMLLRKCVVRDSKKSKFPKQQEASELLSSLGIKKPSNEIPLLGLFLF